jgi:transcriptional repressor NF-X1
VQVHCDDECAIAERNRKLVAAFELDLNEEVRATRVHEYAPETIDMYRRDPLWCGGIERQLTDFVNSGSRQLLFPPMNRDRRRFIHYLADEFELLSVSVDPEPKRSVCITRQGMSKVPVQTLHEAWKSGMYSN